MIEKRLGGVGAVVAPPRQNSWWGTSWLMLTDIVGTSVLTFAGVARQLGWVPTIIFLVAMAPVSIYSALLMSRTRAMLQEQLGTQPLTLGEGARLVSGTDQAALLIYFVVYGLFGFLGNASYLLVLGESLQGVLYQYELCLPSAVWVSCCCVAPLAVSVRHLADSVWLCFGNLFLILAVLGIVMAAQAHEGPVPDSQTFWFAEDLSFLTLFGAMTNIVYSYTGHWLYFEMMAEMTTPEHFPRVFLINAPLQIFLYLTVACWGYYFAGNKAQGFFLDNLAVGSSFQAASALLFVHVVIAFLIKNVVLCHYLHGLLSRRVEDSGGRSRVEYAACALFLLGGSFLVANSIPFFSDLLGLIGGLLSGPVSFLLPMALFLRATRMKASSTNSLGGVQSVDGVLITLIGVFILLTMVVGTYNVLVNIVSDTSMYGLPFSCKLLERT